MDADEASVVGDRIGLAATLAAERERGFVGREALVRWFETALRGSGGERVLFVHGPGGIGKTTLLEAFARISDQAGRTVVYLDGREVPCSASAVAAEVASRSGLAGGADAPDVLLVDGYELLAPLERWFRDELLPSRPADSVTVVAGRSPPREAGWLGPGWRQVLQVQELSGLDRRESVDLLARLGIDQARRDPMARLGKGYPLALALLAQACATGPLPDRLADEPDVVGRLCALIVDDVPDAAHRAGLATCAHAVRMTHDLLAHTVGARADEVWSWLESRPYVRRGAVGLFLHDVVREVFEAEFAQRAPAAYASLHQRVRDYFLMRLTDPTEPHPERAAGEILMLHRRAPLEDGMELLRQGTPPPTARAGVEDHEEIFGLIAEAEGPESAVLARRWAQAQPRSLYRVRADDGVVAFAMQVYLPAGDGLDEDDPVAVAIRRAVDEHGPLRPGERINVNRYAGASSGAYQRHHLTLLVNGVSCILEWALEPAAWTFIVTIDADLYGPYFQFLGLERKFVLDAFGQQVTGYGWDRRRFPPAQLFELMARRELSGETGPPPESMLRPAPLSRDAFTAAALEALRDLDRPDRLTGSPLLGTSLVDAHTHDAVEDLRSLVRATIDGLEAERRGADHRRVLQRTYLKGAPSQEAAAAMLDLPFSTYRRHLARAQERLVEVLWATEIGVRPSATALGTEQEVSTE